MKLEGHVLRPARVPDVSAPPLHTLPHDDLVSRLRALTNLRVVPDATSASGYGVEPDRAPRWSEQAVD